MGVELDCQNSVVRLQVCSLSNVLKIQDLMSKAGCSDRQSG